MTGLIRTYLTQRFSQGSLRSIKAKRNILGLFFLRGVALAVNFLLVPLTLSYLNPTRYGVWLTLPSIIGQASTLDITSGCRAIFVEILVVG